MRKGFTLIELLAILTVLGIIILVSAPSIMETNKKSQENDYTEYKHTVEKAAEVYLETHSENFYNVKSTNGSKATIKSEDLVSLGYIQGSLQNPKTKVKIIEEASYVEVKNNNGTLEYTYILP